MSSKSFPYRFGILCSLSVVFFFIIVYFLRIVVVFQCQNMSNLSQKNVLQKAGPNTEKYGPWSEYGLLRTGCRPVKIQDSLKPYNKI